MSFYKIQTITLGSTQASIDFTTIPSTYDHLVILCNTRRNSASGTGSGSIQFNGDTNTTGNYRHLQMTATGQVGGSTGTQAYAAATVNLEMFNTGNSTDTTNSFPQNTIYIWNYTNSNYVKFANGHGSQFNVGSGGYSYQTMYAGNWGSTATITSIKMFPTSGASFIAGSSATLYGIKTSGGTGATVS
jgi:hypothetical protein